MSNIYYFLKLDGENTARLFDIVNLDNTDTVALYLEGNGDSIDTEEIEEQKNDIIDNYLNSYEYKRDNIYNSGVDYGDLCFSYTETPEWLEINNLEYEIENRIILEKDDEFYKKIYAEAVKYGY